MRGIALTIFLSFWLMQAAIIATFAVLPDAGASRRLTDHTRQDGMVAVRLLEEDGPAACNAYLSALARDGQLEVAVVDAAGTTVCGTSVAASVTPLAKVDVRGTRGTYAVAGHGLPAFLASSGRPGFPWTNVLLTIVVSGMVCFAMARYLAAPLREVRDVSYRLAAGDLQARVGPAVGVRRDEIGDLVRDFDRMAARIEALVHSQNQLLSDISHELRSPLARLNVSLELARRRAGDAAQPDLDRLEAEASRMTELIGRILALSRAETPDAAHPFELVDLREVVSVVADNAEYEAQEQGKTVRFECLADPLVMGDAELLASAVDNVVRNALRYTPATSSVDVRLEVVESEAVLAVRDHGPGVPEGELERIFTPFHRVDAGRGRDAGGAGLGLAIARRAVALHKGSLSAALAESGGLVVTMRLPLTSVSHPVHAR